MVPRGGFGLRWTRDRVTLASHMVALHRFIVADAREVLDVIFDEDETSEFHMFEQVHGS